MKILIFLIILIGVGLYFGASHSPRKGTANSSKKEMSQTSGKIKLGKPKEVDLSNFQYPFPEAIVPVAQINWSITENDLGPLAPFGRSDLQKFSYQYPDMVLAQLTQVAAMNLTFSRGYPGGSSIPSAHIEHALPWLSKLRSALRAGLWSYPAYLQGYNRQPAKALETLRLMFAICSKFRKTPGYEIELQVAIALDSIALDAASKMKASNAVNTAMLDEIVRQYRPTREQYTSAMQCALNGADDIFANYVKLYFSKDAIGQIQKLSMTMAPGMATPTDDEITKKISYYRNHDPQVLLREYNELLQKIAASFKKWNTLNFQKAVENSESLKYLPEESFITLEKTVNRLNKILQDYDAKFPLPVSAPENNNLTP